MTETDRDIRLRKLIEAALKEADALKQFVVAAKLAECLEALRDESSPR